MQAADHARMLVMYGLGNQLPEPELTAKERETLEVMTDAMDACVPWRNPVDQVIHYFGIPEINMDEILDMVEHDFSGEHTAGEED